MRFSKGVLYAGLASAILFAVSAPAKAAGIPVDSDSGGTLATAANVNSTTITLVSNPGSTISDVNGTSTSLGLGIAEAISGSGGVISGISGTKIITDGTNSVQLELRALTGTYNTTGLTVDATITGVTGSNDVGGYNFYSLLGGSTVLTATGDFAALFADTPGTTLSDVPFSVAEAAAVVPEPSTMALLGFGMTGFFAFRRFFKRHATA